MRPAALLAFAGVVALHMRCTMREHTTVQLSYPRILHAFLNLWLQPTVS
jgi:hypothetical protein